MLAGGVCGAGITTTFSYGAGANAPTGAFGAFTPPPGSTGARCVLELDNPPGGAAGGQSYEIAAALNTQATSGPAR